MLGPVADLLGKRNVELKEQDREALQLVQRNGLRLQKLVDALLNFSRLEAGRVQASYELTDIAALTGELASTFRSAVEKAGLKLIVECEPVREQANIDREMWETIIFNLLSNALKFTFDGRIKVSLRQIDRTIELAVSDTGTGIPERELPHIFERFHRVEGAKGRTIEGSGIGLALVSELVKLHNGKVAVESEIGRGSTFTVLIPISQSHRAALSTGRKSRVSTITPDAYIDEALRSWEEIPFDPALPRGQDVLAAPRPKFESRSVPASRMRIMIADDNADMRDYVRRLLEEEYEVEVARDGKEALALALDCEPDLVVSDVMMPELDGFGLLRELRAHPRTQAIPVILLSARAGEESRIEGMQSGADDYLIKPFTARELLARVKAHLNISLIRKESLATLRESEARYRTLFETTQDGILIVDDEGRYVDVNSALCRMLKASKENLIGAHFSAFMPSERLEEAVHAFLRLKETGKGIVRFPMRALDGTVVEMEWTAAGNYIPGFHFCTCRDVTERIKQEEALRESEARLQLALEAATLGTWEFDTETGNAVASDRVREMFGASIHEAPEDFWFSRVHPEDRERVQAEFTAALSLEQMYDTEFRVLSDDMLRWVQSKGQVIKQDHRNRRLVGVAEDITVRKLSELALRESESRNRIILESALDGVITIDERDGITEWSSQAEAIFGWSRTEAVGMPLTNIIPPQHREAHRSGMARYFATGEGPILNRRIEMTALRKSGEEFPVELSIAPTTAGGRQLFSAFVRDITERKTWENALRESESRFRQLAESITEVFYIADAIQPCMLYISPGYEKIWGRTCESLYAEPLSFLDAIHADDRPRVLAALEAQSRGENTDAEFRIIRPDGSLRWIWDRSYPIHDAEGRVYRTAGIAEDITRRHVAEEELRAAQERLNIALKSAPLIFYTANKELRYTWMHQPHPAFDLKQFIGKRDDEILPAEHARDLIELKQRVIETGIGERKEISLEISGKREIYDITVEPLFDIDRAITGLIVAALDITERARAEETIRQSERAFRELADSMPQMVWTARPDGYLDYYNERWYEFTGFPRGEGGDRSWKPILHPDDVQRCYDVWYASVQSGEAYEIEYRFWDRATSSYRWFLGRALPVKNEAGRIVRWFGTCTDIDHQKTLQAELQRANADLEQFAYSASHDLQEPLRNVSIYSDLISRRYSSALDKQGLEFLGFMKEGASRMEMLIQDLLAYTRVASRGEGGPAETTDANKALRAALSNLTEAVKQNNAQVIVDSLPEIGMREVHLQQLFQNLIGNAIKYRREEQPQITLSAKRQDGHWLFVVRDNGIGINPEYKERIFGIFKRLHGDKYSGTGIGLAICQRIVERYRGRIWVESEPGKGSTFFFTVPS